MLGLVKQRLKTATSSAFVMYDTEEKLPQSGRISIIVFGNGVPGCVIETTEVVIKRFDEIQDCDARLEGEGDLSMEYWQEVHRYFFRQEYKEKGKIFMNRYRLYLRSSGFCTTTILPG